MLRRSHEQLEVRVRERTAELARANESLREEMRERERADRARTDLLARLVFAQEDERRRIAREMHDQFGEQLTALGHRIASLKDACGDRAELRASGRSARGRRAAARSRRRSSGLGAAADRARRSRPARRRSPTHVQNWTKRAQHRRGAAHLGAVRRSPRLRGRDDALPHRAGSADQRRQAFRRRARRRHPGAARRSGGADRRGRWGGIRSGRRRDDPPAASGCRACRSARRWSARPFRSNRPRARARPSSCAWPSRHRTAGRRSCLIRRFGSCSPTITSPSVTG